jgi:excisionase family DNA binding protein
MDATKHARQPRGRRPRTDPHGRFLTPSEVAEDLRVSTTTVMRWIHDGRLPAIRVSERVYRIPVPAFDRFLSGAPTPRPTIVYRDVDELPELWLDDEGIPDEPPARELPDPPG